MTAQRSDEQLLAAFTRGDEPALGELAARYEAALVGLARGVLGGREDAARDAVQESWVRVIKAARNFGGRSSVKTWLYRIVINKCLDARRRHASHNGPPPSPAETVEPVRALDAAERREALLAAMERLSGEARLLLLLCYHEGMSHPDAAEVLEIPVGTLKSRLNAALQRLRAELNEYAEATP